MTFPRLVPTMNYSTGEEGFTVELSEGKFWEQGGGRRFYTDAEYAQQAIDNREYVAIKVIPFTRALEAEMGLDDDYGSDQNVAKLRAWLDANNCHYYAAEKHDFSEYVACREAARAGKTAVIMENLS